MSQRIKQVYIEPRDFSGRKYFPGTSDHPFKLMDTFQVIVEIIPAPVYIILFSGLTGLIFQDWHRCGLIGTAVLADWFLLSLLPKIKLSYGPPTLTLVLLAVMRMLFLLFTYPSSIIIRVLGTFLLIYGFYMEPFFPKVESYRVLLTGRSKTGCFRIIHLSDVHISCFSRRESRVIEIVNALEPDLIVFSIGLFFCIMRRISLPKSVTGRSICSFQVTPMVVRCGFHSSAQFLPVLFMASAFHPGTTVLPDQSWHSDDPLTRAGI